MEYFFVFTSCEMDVKEEQFFIGFFQYCIDLWWGVTEVEYSVYLIYLFFGRAGHQQFSQALLL